MTNSVPDGVSTSDLEDFAKQAKAKAKAEKKAAKKAEKGPYDGLSDDAVITLANKALDKVYAKCSDPISHKVIAMQVIHNLMRWHARMSESEAEKGDHKSSAAWACDAGRLKVALDTMRAVGLHSDDFTYRADEDFKIFPEDE